MTIKPKTALERNSGDRERAEYECRMDRAVVVGEECDREFIRQCRRRGLPVALASRAPLDYLALAEAHRGAGKWVH